MPDLISQVVFILGLHLLNDEKSHDMISMKFLNYCSLSTLRQYYKCLTYNGTLMIDSSHLSFFYFNWWACLRYILLVNLLVFLLFNFYRGRWLWRPYYCCLTIIQQYQVSQPFLLLMISYAPLICLGAEMWIQFTVQLFFVFCSK